MMTLNLLGYIDPAATTALISSLTAIGVAVGATFIIFWRKLKKFVFKLLRKDENAGKIVEEKLVVYDQDVIAAVQAKAASSNAVKAPAQTTAPANDADQAPTGDKE